MNHVANPLHRAISNGNPALTSRFAIVFAAVVVGICAFTGTAAARGPSSLAGTQPFSTTSHVATWALDDGCTAGGGARAGFVHSWVTFAESSCGPNAKKALNNCHAGNRMYCFTIQYLETATSQTINSLRESPFSSWWLHAPGSASPISSDGTYIVNQANPAVQKFYGSYVRSHYNQDEGLMLDGQAPSLAEMLYDSRCNCSRTREIRTNAQLQAAHRKFSEALTHRNGQPFLQIDNALAPNPYLPQGVNMISPQHGVYGLVIEGYPENFGQLDAYYTTLLDQIAYVETRTKGFVMPLSYGNAGASYQQQSRRVQEATIMLGYSKGHIVDWEDLDRGSSDLSIWPEEGIYPTHPLESMKRPSGRGCLAGKGTLCSKGGHNSLRVAHGVYRREFGTCYDRNVMFGDCAGIVNTSSNWVTVKASWLHRSYGHVITFVGGDSQSGGSLDLHDAAFHAGSTAIAPHDAILLAH
jgi:hypothetical protein